MAVTVRGGQTFGKTIGVLRVLAGAQNGYTFTDLMVASGQPKATLHRLVQSMMEERLVRYDAEDRRYRLGYGFLELAGMAWSRMEIRVLAGDSLKALSQSSGETAFLEILDGEDTVVVENVDNRRQGGSAPPMIGRRAPARWSAGGKALLASLDEASADRLLEAPPSAQPKSGTTPSHGELLAQLALVRRNGYAMDAGEEPGSTVIAAAILDRRSRPAGAIGLVIPAGETSRRSLGALTRMVTATATEITLNWGGRPPATQLSPRISPVPDLVDSEPSWLPEGDVPC